MDNRQQRVLQSLRRVQGWCAANPGLVPPPVGSPQAWTPLTRQLDTLNAIVTQATDAAAQQEVLARQTTLAGTDELALRKHLRSEMHVVAQVAQALRKSVPGIGVLKMPEPQLQVEGLLRATAAFTSQASTYETVLVEHGLAPDFVAQLRDAISALQGSVDGRGMARAGQVGATKQLAVNIALGHQYVSIMDAALTKTLKTDSAKLVEWRNSKRVTTKAVSTADFTSATTSISTATRATPTLVTHTAASTPLPSTPATMPAGIPEPDAKAA